MESEKVSVVLTTFNRADKVSQALESVLSQSHPADEVIVVDDGSQDSTQEVLAKFGDAINVVWQPNKGVAASRNAGAKKATGALIAFIDDDDIWYPWKLELQIKIMKALPQIAMLSTNVDGEGELGKFPQLITREFFNRFEKQHNLREADIFPCSVGLNDLNISLPSMDGDAKIYYGNIFNYMWVKLFILNSTVLWRSKYLVPFPDEISVGTDTPFYIERSKSHDFAYLDISTISYNIYGSGEHISKKLINHYGGIVDAHYFFFGQGERLLPHHRSSYKRQLAYFLHRIAIENLSSYNRKSAQQHAIKSLRVRWNQLSSYLILMISITPKAFIKHVLKLWK